MQTPQKKDMCKNITISMWIHIMHMHCYDCFSTLKYCITDITLNNVSLHYLYMLVLASMHEFKKNDFPYYKNCTFQFQPAINSRMTSAERLQNTETPKFPKPQFRPKTSIYVQRKLFT